MAEGSSFDLAHVVGMSIVVVVMIAIAVKLIPLLAQVAWQVFPSVLILVLIYGVLRGMVKKFFD